MSHETPLREVLAELAHEQWSGWMKYLFSKCMPHTWGDVVIPANEARRWQRQMQTPYAELPEAEKESDRAEADRVLACLASPDEAPSGRLETGSVKCGDDWTGVFIRGDNALMGYAPALRSMLSCFNEDRPFRVSDVLAKNTLESLLRLMESAAEGANTPQRVTLAPTPPRSLTGDAQQ